MSVVVKSRYLHILHRNGRIGNSSPLRGTRTNTRMATAFPYSHSASSPSQPLQSLLLRGAGRGRSQRTSLPAAAAGVIPNIFTRNFLDVKFAASKTSTATATGGAARGGKSEADLLVEELQELYEAAKDEFEIATDSTESATIYAASDREAARDALDQFVGVYHLYTTPRTQTTPPTDSISSSERQGQQEQENQIADLEEATTDDDGSNLITTNYDPTTIPTEVRDEVKRRVGQRVRELKRAVEDLEERAHAE